MSRLWTDKINIYLHPGQVVLVRESGLFKRRITDKQLVAVPDVEDDPWRAVLVCLQCVLREARWQGGVQIILSNRFARFLTVPWDDRLKKNERNALLQHRFEDVYGYEMRAASLAVADVGYGKQGVACAVASNTMDALESVCKAAGVKLASVKPFLMAALNAMRGEIDALGAWLVLAERSCLTIALVQGGEWRSVRCSIADDSWAQQLDVLLEREALSSGVEAVSLPVYVFWPEKPDIKPVTAAGQSVILLKLSGREGYSPLADRDFVPAMCG